MTNTFKSPLQKAVVTWLADHPDMSRKALAAAAEIDPGDMSRICSGAKPSLNMDSAVRLAKAMGTTVEALLDGTATPAGDAANAVRVEAAAGETVARLIPTDLIDPSPDNPRKSFDEEALGTLAASIAEQGLLQPITLRPTGERFEIVFGERRWRAMKLNAATVIPAFVRPVDDADARALRIVENLQRQDIKPLEEADAFLALQQLDPAKWTAAAIGRAVGMSDRFVAQRIALARNLDADLKAKLAEGELKVEVARVLAGAPIKLQKVLAKDSWALRDADAVRRKLQDKAIPLSAAAFKVELYDGDYLEEDGKKWFADVAKFKRLQTAAAEARAARLTKTFPGAKLVKMNELDEYVWADDGNQINTYWGNKSEAEGLKKGLEDTDCTALVYLDRNKIKTVKKVVLRTVWDEKADKTKPRQEAPQRRDEETDEEKQARALNENLTTALGHRVDIAKRLVVYAFFGVNGAAIDTDVDPRPYLDDLADTLGSFVESGGYYPERYEVAAGASDKLWATLRALDDRAIDSLLARLMSEMIHVGSYSHADGLTRAIAAELNVDIPATMIPALVEEVEGEPDTDTDVAEAA